MKDNMFSISKVIQVVLIVILTYHFLLQIFKNSRLIVIDERFIPSPETTNDPRCFFLIGNENQIISLFLLAIVLLMRVLRKKFMFKLPI